MRKIVAVFVCLLFVVSVLGASAVVVGKGKPVKPPKEEENLAQGTETQITDELGWEIFATIFGDKIVWADNRHEGPLYYDIYMYHLGPDGIPSGDDLGEYPVTTAPNRQWYPAIYGNKIVWEDFRNGNLDIYMYDLGPDGIPGTGDDGGEYQITTDPNHQASPDIYENKIVYRNSISGIGMDIFIYDLTTGKEVEIPEEYSWAKNPRIFGNKVVYEVETDEDISTCDSEDIVIYDISTGTRTIIEKRGRDILPAIYGDIVVWSHNEQTRANARAANWDIYMYNIATGEETQLTSDKAKQMRPDIHGNIVVWTDERNDIGYPHNIDIYMYDLGLDGLPHTEDDGGEYRVTTNEALQAYPSIYGNNIVYRDNRHGNDDVYMFTLEPSP